MANYKSLIPFILYWEGGYQKDPNDLSGTDTNKGITYTTWKSVFGDTHDRFMKMVPEDWETIFKNKYWDLMCGDKINYQSIVNLCVDWCWASGRHYPSIDIQDILIHAFGNHITEDGQFGPATVAAINGDDEQRLLSTIIEKRMWYCDQVVLAHPSQQKFIKGWKNRINSLVNFNKTGKIK